jgi:hypothetical protein
MLSPIVAVALCLPMSAEYEIKYNTYAFQQIAILGTQVFLSPLKNLANSIASSEIRVSTSCFLPTFTLGISTVL